MEKDKYVFLASIEYGNEMKEFEFEAEVSGEEKKILEESAMGTAIESVDTGTNLYYRINEKAEAIAQEYFDDQDAPFQTEMFVNVCVAEPAA